jgi:AcrR family transcriptional regulator
VQAPIIRRPTAQDAVDLAEATFVNEDRVELATLARALSLSQGTLYRWFGSREQLLDQVLERLIEDFAAAARAEAEGEGDDYLLDVAGRIMATTVSFQPFRAFVAREPELALRLILGKGAAAHRVLTRELRQIAAEKYSPQDAKAIDRRADTIIQVGTALQWATFAIGDEPELEAAAYVVRSVLAATRAPTTA